MSKFSVKKPMTVFVVVVVIIALGIVSTIKMTPDLLPSIDLPYVVVMTTYPGATPEEVEASVTKPLEQSLATLENLESIQSVSNANYSLIMLEFENDSNMDTAVVNTLQSVDLIEGSWDETIGSPNILKINPTMLPIAIAAVDKENTNTEEMSNFVSDTLMNELEGITGVASISAGGLIESKVNVVINEDKIEKLNDKLVNEVGADLADARKELNSGLSELKKAEATVAESRAELETTKDETYDQLAEAASQLDAGVAQVSALATQIKTLEGQKMAIQAQLDQQLYAGSPAAIFAEQQTGVPITVTQEDLMAQMTEVETQLSILQMDSAAADAQLAQLQEAYREAERGSYDAIEGFDDAEAQLNSAQSQLASQRAQINSALKQLDDAANSKLMTEGLSTMITMDMVSGILQGQNFSMPAGYVQSGDTRYLVSVGDKIENTEEIEKMFLFDIEGLGKIHLEDVADVFITDNSDAVYGSINGNPGVMLTFSKQSNYPTATVSNNIADKFEELSAEYEGLSFTMMMDQGDYIYLIIGAIGSSLGWGAVFAVLVLLFFLRDLKPTFITLLSIPVSIVFALVLMYFSGVTINMISLSGLAVAVGMLVDNSIVVIENIFRLRRLGVSPAKAAVAGAKQVAAAITSSTLTTVCVFVPIIFTDGLTRQLFTDMALTITYALTASLIIALTLVPAMSSMMLKKVRPESKGFLAFQNGYRRLASWNLRHKVIVLLVSVGLLAFTAHATLAKGFIFMPEMSTPQLSGSLVMSDEEADITETSEVSDEALKRIEAVEGVETAGAMLSSSGSMGSLTGETENATVSLYIILDEESDRSGDEINEDIVEACKDLPCEISIMTSTSMMSYTSAMGGEGIGVNVYSTDNDTLQEAAREIGEILEDVEGIAEVNNGLTEAEPELHFAVDKQKAMEKGLTVAQVFMQVSDALSNETTSTTLHMDGNDYDVVVVERDSAELTPKFIKNLKLTGTNADGEEITVKLKNIAEVIETESLPSINRIDQRTYLGVSASIEEGYNVTLVTDAAEEALKAYEAPEDVTYEFSGENEMIMEAMEDLLLMMVLGILLVYLIMVAQFQSLRSPFIIMFTIPLAFTGGLGALLIFDKEISIIAMIGLIMLVGIIVNNGIVLVDYINQLRAEGMTKKDAIIEAGATRMRPVMMTSLTTILGLVVMAVGKTAGTDMMQPIALVSIGGLIYATIMTLFVVPVIYDLFNGETYKMVKEEDVDVSDLVVE